MGRHFFRAGDKEKKKVSYHGVHLQILIHFIFRSVNWTSHMDSAAGTVTICRNCLSSKLHVFTRKHLQQRLPTRKKFVAGNILPANCNPNFKDINVIDGKWLDEEMTGRKKRRKRLIVVTIASGFQWVLVFVARELSRETHGNELSNYISEPAGHHLIEFCQTSKNVDEIVDQDTSVMLIFAGSCIILFLILKLTTKVTVA
ncbi:transmembrane protein, putative [Medicago truncatula]|uniref:Transmembrane protein, putative n=1 Tax=Medicago truncatula TaxID=3880 RepID=G7KY18_MEDTR|nr:transmembrane protein, putative [Medicago truncatula]